jgi:hypothetical protein
MVKVHRMYRHSWRHPSKEITDEDEETQAYAVLANCFGFSAAYIKKVLESHFAPSDNAGPERAASTVQEKPAEDAPRKWTVQEIRAYLSTRPEATRRYDDDEKIAGIPPEIDALDWYQAWAKIKKGEMPAQGQTKKKEVTKEYYAEMVYEIYKSSGYSIEDSVGVTYTPRGQEIMRYLAKTTRFEQDAMNG